MFITDIANKAKISDLMGEVGQTTWLGVELVLNAPWFFVELLHTELTAKGQSTSFIRCVLLSSLESVENLLKLEPPGLTTLQAVYIVTPKRFNGSENWQMALLEAMWTGEEPTDPGQTVDIYQLQGGARFARSYLGTAVDDLVDIVLRFKMPLNSA